LVLDCLFPQSCIGCGRPGRYFCARCEAQLPWIFPPLCPRCGRPQASAILCPVCAQTMSAISVIRSPLRFEGAARRAIHELKYHNLRAIAPTLAAYLVRTLRDTGYKPDLIVPVPLHPARARRRGYNQSLLLAREVGRATCTPVSADALARVREGTSHGDRMSPEPSPAMMRLSLVDESSWSTTCALPGPLWSPAQRPFGVQEQLTYRA
jgi:predicted amidophosphoribosyltransferase